MSLLRKIRIISQISFFILFIFLFFYANSYPQAYNWPSEWFLRLNPLVGFLTTIAGRSIFFNLLLLSGIVFVITVLFGRVFCGFICPLGTTIDWCDRYIFNKIRVRKDLPPQYLQSVKYFILAGLVLLALFGAIFPLFMDPISLFTRIITLIVYPFIAVLQADGQHYLRPVFRALGSDGLAYATIKIPLFYGGLGALILAVAVFIGGLWDKRFWCQYICPSGAFFGFLSRFAVFRRTTDSSVCNSCRVCARTCPTRAISEKTEFGTSLAECIVCGLCTEVKRGCTKFGFARPSLATTTGPDVNRRHILAGVFGGVLMVPVLRADAFNKRDNTGRLIRPPGAVPEDLFASRCIACGECMKVCPTNAIQPCVLSDGFGRIYTPKIVPRIGGCEEKCHACGQVCPTGALRPLSYEEKRFVKIGTAVIDRHRCLAWEQNKECLVCDEVCPYNAISAKFVKTTTGMFKVPVVNEDLCLGCGYCEQHCPIFDKAAIVVYKFAENRRADGPYVSKWQKESIINRRRMSDDEISEAYTFSEESGTLDTLKGESGGNTSGAESGAAPEEPDLPEGFIMD
ncbi:MAG: 4Fe-4S dicluster domain-containing protein [Chitinivibrionales bacterium]|nr:4Fe-4S dicluster domain-containing protein [Chitinivibrionales bacterium]